MNVAEYDDRPQAEPGFDTLEPAEQIRRLRDEVRVLRIAVASLAAMARTTKLQVQNHEHSAQNGSALFRAEVFVADGGAVGRRDRLA